MAHVLVVSFPAAGHINPTLPVIGELVRRGHRVSVVVPEQYRDPVEAAGGRVLTYPSLVPDDWSGIAIPRHPDADQLARAQRDTVRETLTPLPSVVADLDVDSDGSVCTHERPEVVVYDVLGSAAGRLLSLAWDLPSVVTCPTFVGNETFSPYVQAVAEGEAEAPDPAHPAMLEAGAILRDALDTWGLQDVAVGDFVSGAGERCRLVFLPRAFHPGEDTFDERFRFVGPCLRSGADDAGWTPPASGRPVVLVSLGTLGYDDSAALLRRTIDAVGKIGGHAVVSVVVTWVRTGSPFVVPSAMSKAGVDAMTKSLAVEWGRYGIRFNAIAPGVIPTSGAQTRLRPGDAANEGPAARNPLGRVGQIHEMGDLAAFMLSPACSWLNGETIALDGGDWLANGAYFTDYLDWSDEKWTEVRDRMKADNAAEKTKRGGF